MSRPSHRRRLSVESLETRKLMAGDYASGDVFKVTDDNAFSTGETVVIADTVAIESARTGDQVVVNMSLATSVDADATDGVSQQINEITSYIDASNVYGSDGDSNNDGDRADAIDALMADHDEETLSG